MSEDDRRLLRLQGWGLPERFGATPIAVMDAATGRYVAVHVADEYFSRSAVLDLLYGKLEQELAIVPVDAELEAAKYEARRTVDIHPRLIEQFDQLLAECSTKAEIRDLVCNAEVASWGPL